jgi:alpha-L-fucosidase
MKCPLCQQELIQIGESDWKEYFCRTRIKFEGKTSLPHYELREDSNGLACWYIPPYRIQSNGKKTIVGKLDESAEAGYGRNRFTKPEFKQVFEMDEVIHPDKPEKLLARIKLLTLFS